MASYKVAQDVEADDKLLGPFSFRQVIYLGIVAMACGIAYFLWQLLPPLAIIPMPVILFFGALALPLRKDQPMETYLAAMLSYYLKPHKRLWVPDGLESLVQVSVPKVSEENRIKTLGGDETERRLAYLATLVDTGGWSIRNAQYPTSQQSSPMNQDVYNAAQQIGDPLDNSGRVASSFDRMIDVADASRRQQVINMMKSQPVSTATAAVVTRQPQQVQANIPMPTPQSVPAQPTSQAVIAAPVSDPIISKETTDEVKFVDPVQQTPSNDPLPSASGDSASVSALSPDIMELANNKDLSVETMQREVHRIHNKNKHQDDNEVLISLR